MVPQCYAGDVGLNRDVSFTSDGLTLEGILHLPDATPAPGLVVCHPHPQHGGDMWNNVVTAVCQTALAAGVAALRFNFRGTGRSEGAYDGGRGEQEDVAAALSYLRSLAEIDAGRLALAGYSFGAAMALRAAGDDRALGALIAISLPTASGDWPAEATPGCPVLFLSGDRDQYSDPEALRRLAAGLGDRAQVTVMPGVDHFWAGSQDRLQKAVAGCLSQHLAPRSQ